MSGRPEILLMDEAFSALARSAGGFSGRPPRPLSHAFATFPRPPFLFRPSFSKYWVILSPTPSGNASRFDNRVSQAQRNARKRTKETCERWRQKKS